MPFRRHGLGFKCPKCGRTNGFLKRKIVKLSQKTLTQKNMPTHKVKRHFLGDRLLHEEDVSLNKNAYITNMKLFLESMTKIENRS